MEIHCTVSSFSAHSHSNHAGNGGRADKQKIRIERTNAICVAQKSIENTLQKHSSNNLEYRFLISYNDYIAMFKHLKYKVFWHITTDKIVG